jgi:hypothetical protein|tara:strand:+ start:191 stop:511 length:321 start_codon:yes stop_codon:yes gene_type:complete
MAWAQWINNAVVDNVVLEEKGVGDNWKEIIDQTLKSRSKNKKIVIVEEGGYLYKRFEDLTLTYSQKREQEYPHYRDQLDMMYKDQLNGTTTWKDKITEIKDKYPKE